MDEQVERELMEEVRELREEVSGPSHAQVLFRGALIGGVIGLVWSQRHRIALRATGRILTAFSR
jgi:hypothetical protein